MSMEILDHFRDILKLVDSPLVLEFGACDGYHSNQLVSAIKAEDPKSYTFHCFEPRADLHPQIINNLHGHLMHNNGAIGIFPFAVGAEDGEVTFYSSAGERWENNQVIDRYYGSSSIRKPTSLNEKEWPGMRFTETRAQVKRLDSHLSSHGLNRRVIDFIWADIQGAEIDLIKGAPEALKRTRYLYTEYSNAEYYEGQAGIDTILELTGFEIVEDYGSDILLKNKIFRL